MTSHVDRGSSYPALTNLFIDGLWRSGSTGKTIPVENPANQDLLGAVASATLEDLNEALAAAQRGFVVWSKTSAFERSKLMRRAADLVRDRRESIATLITLEQGKPLAESIGEVSFAPDIIDWFAEEARRTSGQVIPARANNIRQMTVKEPLGPVAAFTPWNFPINQVVRKLSAALAAGCSIIVKAPEETPASPAELIRAFEDAGIPNGVINLVYGDPGEISSYLIPHPVIRKVSFTGSTAVGKQLAGLAGLHMKRATMELGGHAPVIVDDSADISAAVRTLAVSKFRNAGQVCVSPTRFLVHERVYDKFVDGFTDAAQATKVGEGLAEGTGMGPLANSRRVAALEEYISDAVEHGAELRTGGRRIGNKGHFFEPTVLTDVPLDARVMNEEPFGPVALINRFSHIDDAIQEANRLPFGLASFAFTASLETAQDLSRRLEAGMVTINHNGLSLPEVPFGGIKDSGFGTEGGSEAIEAYLNTKFVTLV
jgi:succinate-semialdehyde dehydrogenase/glutarate-semialdehyde dehydrogenase